MPRYRKQKLVGYKAWAYYCNECDWRTEWLDKIRYHVRHWSRQGELIPHQLDEQGTPRQKEAR